MSQLRGRRPGHTTTCNRSLVIATLALAAAHWPAAAQEATPTEAQRFFDEAAEQQRLKEADKTFEEFKASVYREPFAGGKFIVNGDTAIADEKALEEFFENNVKAKRQCPDNNCELAVYVVGGLDAVWNATDKKRLTYCVSSQFGSRYNAVVVAMTAATQAWEAAADIDFLHLADEDGDCVPETAGVVFDVRPVNVNGRYLARAFFPNEARPGRNVLIDQSAFRLDPNGALTLTGVLRHELGHALGARHEHTRPDSGACFEDADWRGVTDYDAFSTMHYPQCNGLGDWSLRLTDKDKSGIACLYGAASGFTIDTTICKPAGVTAKSEAFEAQAVADAEERRYGPFRIKSGTPFVAEIKGVGAGAGDPDLYLKFDDLASRASYDCRPYLSGAEEKCAVDVPAGKQGASVMVRGYTAASYRLSVTYTPRE